MHAVDYYLEKGFDKKAAEYFASGRKRIVSVAPMQNYELLLSFDNNEKRILDMRPVIQPGTVFSFLADQTNFNRVYLDVDSSVAWDIDPAIDSNVVWNNKVDLCPDSCYMDSIPIC